MRGRSEGRARDSGAEEPGVRSVEVRGLCVKDAH